MAWHVETGKNLVVATFSGHLTAEEGLQSALEFAQHLRNHDVADVIFDVHEMTGYDTKARTAWQDKLMPLRKRILSITVRGGNSIVRMGATIMGMALQVPVHLGTKE